MSGWTTNGLAPIAAGSLTGNETLPVDTNLPNGQSPQSGAVSLSVLAAWLHAAEANGPNFRNFLDGGDFGVNPWQRGTSFTGISNTATYTADRWAALGGASSSISVSQQAIAAGALQGFAQALQFGRAAANANTATINLAQALETADCYRAQGQSMTVSFWAKAGANFSAANSALSVQLAYGAGSNQSVANLIGGSWTSQANAVNSTATLTTAWQRFSFTTAAAIPNTATQLGVVLSYAPVGTAGANDWFQIAGVQLEVGPEPSAFEFRDIQVELEICQRYFWQINEPGTGVVVGAGMNTGASAQVFYLATPVQLRAAPTVTVSAGTFKTNQAGTATATTITAGATHTPNAISINGNSAGTGGQATLLQGGGGTGSISVSADL